MPKRNPEAEKQIADNAGMILSAIAGLSARLGAVESGLERLMQSLPSQPEHSRSDGR